MFGPMAIGDSPRSPTPAGRLVARLARTRFVRAAMADSADLDALKGRPSPGEIVGVAAIGVSYIIGWPAIALLGFLAAHYDRAALVVVGGPLAYGVSHLVFLAGAWLAGRRYGPILLRRLARSVMRRLLDRYPGAEPGLSET